ncbi:hypothetical protein [Labedaea rhizosphaerae]|uniref:Lipoprotein n=1 Tax=Labedaea rhizosphaerae TaxID=598644 RepID=A0A4R6SN39_LABRH|nr:hypothetical protein [Labedaea rhizosphaerae]TDQ04603.1 hypothetical protein EV186_101555 [Labedaea rhizosphaerae]
MRRVLAGLVTASGLWFAACSGPTQVSGVDPLTTNTTPPTKTTTTTPARPFVEPDTYVDKSWTYKPDPANGGSGAFVEVPRGWTETKRDTYWSDFLDPSGQVRLRVDVTAGLTGTDLQVAPAKAAADELNRVNAADGFRMISQRTLAPGGPTGLGAAEIVYQFSRDGQTVQCTYRFIGIDDITQARMGVYYPASEQTGAEKVLGAVQDSLQLAG